MSYIDKFFIGFGSQEREYLLNGVRYLVTPKFEKQKTSISQTTLFEKLKKIIGSGFADLTSITDDTKLNIDTHKLTAAEKED